MKNIYKFYFFDFYGRGECIRMLLNYKGIPFQDIRIKREDWPQIKNTIPNGQLPCIEFSDGKKMGQSISMLIYLGRVHGCYPTDVF